MALRAIESTPEVAPRVRQDFDEERGACGSACMLPADCEDCFNFVCNACEQVTSWDDGCSDDTPALCTSCWWRFQEGWT